jgi:hypothetical protein
MICTGITYNGTTTITIDYDSSDGTKGSSFTNPYTFQDIYDTDIANSWGVVQKYQNLYVLNCQINITGSDTYFQDYGIQVTYIYDNGTYTMSALTIGDYTNVILGSTTNGIDFQCLVQRGRLSISEGILIENCTFNNFYNNALYGKLDNNLIIKKCSFINCSYDFAFYGPYAKIYDTSSIDSTVYSLSIRNAGYLENVQIIKPSPTAFTFQPSTDVVVNFKDVKTITDSDQIKISITVRSNSQLYFTDCDMKIKVIVYSFSTNTNKRTEVIYNSTFTSLTDGDYYKLYDNNDNIVYEGGEISGETITYRNYGGVLDESSNFTSFDEIYEPFKLVVSKDGFSDLIIPDIYVTPGQPTIIRGSLLKPKSSIKLHGTTLYNNIIN